MNGKILLSLAAAGGAWLFAGTATAQECTSDADCPEGSFCDMSDCACPEGDPECEELCGELAACVRAGDIEPWESECASDADCTDGWICEVVGGTSCAEPVCPDGEECPEPEPCEPEEFSACVPPPPPPCETDADCSDGFVCLEVSYDMCAGAPPCDSEMPDCVPEEPTCEPVSERFCGPRYIAGCEVDSDCGEGFVCADEEACSCSGGGWGGSSGGGTDLPGADDEGSGSTEPEPVDCSCEPTGGHYCQPEAIECAADGDCPEGWSCSAVPSPAIPGTCTYDEETGEEWCDGGGAVGEESFYCAPPDWEAWGAPGSYDDALAGAAGAESDSGTDGGGGGGQARDVDVHIAGSGPDASAGGGGGGAGLCSVAPGNGPTGLFFAALAGLVSLIRSRRRSNV